MTSDPINPMPASSETPTGDDISVLHSYYEQAMKRIMHEYDQRDRDFATHITINAALFTATGFACQWAKLLSPGTWLASSLIVLALSFFGGKSAKALVDSVRSFTYWQCMMNSVLADVEKRILPYDFLGIYGRVKDVGGRPGGADLVEAREALALALRLVWRIIFFMSTAITLLAGAALVNPAIAAGVKKFFS